MNTQQVIDLGADTFHMPKRVIPTKYVKHFIEGFQDKEFSGKRQYITALDPLGGLGGDRQVEVETDALSYYGRGKSLRHFVDKGRKTVISGEWLRQNYTLVPKGESDYRAYASRMFAGEMKSNGRF